MALPEIRPGHGQTETHIVDEGSTPENTSQTYIKKAQLPQGLIDYIVTLPEYSVEDVSTDRGRRYKITVLGELPQRPQYGGSNSRRDIARAMLPITIADYITVPDDVPREAAIGMKAILLMQEAEVTPKDTKYTADSLFEEVCRANTKYEDDINFIWWQQESPNLIAILR